MTTPRYKLPNNREMVSIRATDPIALDAGAKDGIARMIRAHAQPASAEATTYLQTEATTSVIKMPAGFPAYQSAGKVRIQKDATQAKAIPTGPQWSPPRKSEPVTTISTSDQRNQRSALPIER
jgi:hypothetical protein